MSETPCETGYHERCSGRACDCACHATAEELLEHLPEPEVERAGGRTVSANYVIQKDGAVVSYTDTYATALAGAELLFGQRVTQEINHMRFGLEGARRSHQKVTPADPDRVAAYREFEARWNALREEGTAAGFLENWGEGDYLAEPEDVVETIYDETWDEYTARIDELKAARKRREQTFRKP